MRDPAFDHQCGEFSSDDLIPLCDAEFKAVPDEKIKKF